MESNISKCSCYLKFHLYNTTDVRALELLYSFDVTSSSRAFCTASNVVFPKYHGNACRTSASPSINSDTTGTTVVACGCGAAAERISLAGTELYLALEREAHQRSGKARECSDGFIRNVVL